MGAQKGTFNPAIGVYGGLPGGGPHELTVEGQDEKSAERRQQGEVLQAEGAAWATEIGSLETPRW